MPTFATIRGRDGEARFASREDVERALRVGLIDRSDEIRLEGEEGWRPLSSVVSVKRTLWKDHYHWYALAVVLVGAWAAGVRFLGMLIIFGSHALWMAAGRNRRGKSLRWW